MAVYKVPQDVEAEDKLLGPFTFKQFIFLLIATLGIGLAYALFMILPPLAIIPLPIVIFFSVLALPLRKDQPMEVYLAAVVSFLTRPRIRMWRPDGVETLVEVVAPKIVEEHLSKDYSADEVHKRLTYLTELTDSGGWSIRGVNPQGNSLRNDLYMEARQTDDLLDEGGDRAQNIDRLLDKASTDRRQQLIQNMANPQPSTQQAPTTTISYAVPAQPAANPSTNLVSPSHTPMSAIQPEHPEDNVKLVVNPYPAINQSVLSPISQTEAVNAALELATSAQEAAPVEPTPTKAEAGPTHPQETAANTVEQQPEIPTSEEPISPAIIDLANNHKDLSVETLSREANRIKQRELKLKEDEEVFISLR